LDFGLFDHELHEILVSSIP